MEIDSTLLATSFSLIREVTNLRVVASPARMGREAGGTKRAGDTETEEEGDAEGEVAEAEEAEEGEEDVMALMGGGQRSGKDTGPVIFCQKLKRKEEEDGRN